MKIMVLAALTDEIGNGVTARRIADALGAEHRVSLVDVPPAAAWPSLRQELEAQRYDAAIGVNALVAGSLLCSLEIPYLLVLASTDLYEASTELQAAQMARAVAGATRLVAFSPENRARAEWLWPTSRDRLECVARGVTVHERAEGAVLRQQLPIAPLDKVILLPTALTPVKDPLHVIEAFSVWQAVEPQAQLVIVAAPSAGEFAGKAVHELAEKPGIHVLPGFNRPEMLAAIAEADILLNSSLSEGMSGTVIEAMLLDTPVIARHNAGNESIVVHGRTGLLYDTPAEMVNWARALFGSRELRTRLTETAHRQAVQRHDPEREAAAYRRLVQEVHKLGRPREVASVKLSSDLLAAVPQTAVRLELVPELVIALEQMVDRVRRDEALSRSMHHLAGLLATAPPSVAIAAVQSHGFESLVGLDDAATLYLILALLQVPDAETRLAARGVDAATIRATLDDLRHWSNDFRQLGLQRGISLETLEWAQRYLRGELLRVGSMLFDLRPFSLSAVVYRHRKTRRLAAYTSDGREIDLDHGVAAATRSALPEPVEWDVALAPGSPILDMWMPGALSIISVPEIVRSIKDAYRMFAKLSPETAPLAACGETWRLDRELLRVVPPTSHVQAMGRIAKLLPCTLSEAKTIRRIFGPRVKRADLARLPREGMDPVRRAIADYLSRPEAVLRPRAGFALRDEMQRLPDWLTGEPVAQPDAAVRLASPESAAGNAPPPPLIAKTIGSFDIRPGGPPLLGTGSDLGAYRLQRLLGSGGMGQVYLAEHRKLGRQVAIKLLLPELSEDPDIVRRFFHEARVVNQVKHENIVEIFDFVEEIGGPNYLIMEFLDGQNLTQARQRGPFAVRRSLRVLDQVCSALEAAHSKGVVHRDLKPDNVFLTHRAEREDFVKLLDFGIAKTNAGASLNTRVGAVLGTPVYMSPEQGEGRAIDARSDLYSLGVVLHWMLLDELPPRASRQSTPRPAIKATTQGGTGESIPDAMLDLMVQCLRFEPDERPPSAAAVRKELARIDSGRAAPSTRPAPARPRRRWMLWVLAGGLALMASALGFRSLSTRWPGVQLMVPSGASESPSAKPRTQVPPH